MGLTLLEVAKVGFWAGVLAVVVAAFVTAFRKVLSKIPNQLWDLVVKYCSLSVTFTNADTSFSMIQKWLADNPYSQRSRSIKMQWVPNQGKFKPVPGYGLHWLWWRGGPLWIRYGIKDTKSEWGGNIREESYTVTLLAHDHGRMLDFLEDIKRFQKKENTNLLVYTWHSSGYWHWTGPRRKRELKTVYVPATTLEHLIAIIDDFIASEDWYIERGIPYRLGILIYGPPGTGKTTLAMGIASHYNRALYSANLNSIGNDETVLRAFTAADKDGIILIEDIDTFDASAKRDDVPDEVSATATPGGLDNTKPLSEVAGTPAVEKQKSKSLTLSGLLNAIDGVAAAEGRILIMTTNDIDKLDPALVRSGRINERVEVGYMQPDDVVRMFKTFFPEAADKVEGIRRYAEPRAVTGAAWQKMFINYHDDVDKLFREVIDPALVRYEQGA